MVHKRWYTKDGTLTQYASHNLKITVHLRLKGQRDIK